MNKSNAIALGQLYACPLGAIICLALVSISANQTAANEPAPAINNAGEVNFAEHIAPILLERCAQCHRPGQSGPFTLLSYRDAREHADTIAAVVKSGYMPPWKPVDKGIAFADDRHLSTAERAAIEKWISAGCPEGDAAKTPKPPVFTSGWALGTPDLVVKMPEAFTIPASGPDLYRSFVFPINLPEDKWIKAIELRPTARGAVHHALFFADDASSVRRRERDGQPGFRGMNFLGGSPSEILERAPDRVSGGLGGYVPGATPSRLPGDLARFLPRNNNIVMQTHFHPTGKVETEQAELALYFAERAPEHRLQPIQMPAIFGAGAGINVPAGEKNYRVTDSYTLPIDVLAHEVGGHAHYICRDMEMIAKLPDGKELTLLKIDDWDLDWQDQYKFAQPIRLPKGTHITATIIYDNSAENPENPYNPPQTIAWGRESNDEMGAVTLTVTAIDESQRSQLSDEMRERARTAMRARIKSQSGLLNSLGGLSAARGLGNRGLGKGDGDRGAGGGLLGGLLGGQGGDRVAGALIRLLDRNRDGKLQEEELPEKNRDRMLEFVDRNRDGEIDTEEIEAARQLLQRFTEEPERAQPAERKAQESKPERAKGARK